MKKNILTKLFAVLIAAVTLFGLVSCSGDDDKSADDSAPIKSTVLDMTLEEAVTAVTDAGCLPVITNIYDDQNADGAVLSIGEFMKDAKEGDYITICVNDLSFKDRIESRPLAPVIVPKDSYEEKIYSKISSDENIKRKFDSYYTLIETDSATEKDLASFPIAASLSIYVLDTAATDKELANIESYITDNTDYTYADMLADYAKVGILAVPSAKMNATQVKEEELEYSIENDEVTIENYTGDAQNIVIPAQIEGKPVTTLAKGSFPQAFIHAVTFEPGIETIKSGAFSNAYAIYNINFPDTISSVEGDAFTVAFFTDTNVDGFVTLGALGDLLISYDGEANEVAIPDSIRFIGGSAFRHNDIITSVSIPEGVLSIGMEAFRECEKLVAYNIPSTCTKICNGAFRTTRNLTEINIPASVTEIDDYAFFETNEVLSITIGENVERIGREAFVYNLKVTEVNIPSSVTYIGDKGFYKCLVLENVTGAENVTYLGGCAFEEDPWYNNFTPDADGFCIYSGKLLVKYSGTATDVVIPDGVVSVSSAFKDNLKVKTVVVPDTCTNITAYAFGTASALTDVTIPASVTEIDLNAFQNITTTVTIHCEAGSYAETYAKDNHIKYDNNI